MKARVIQTGEVIDVVPKVNPNAQSSLDNLYDSNNRIYRGCELDFINIYNKVIDWEQRRYEIAKAAMQSILSNDNSQAIAINPNDDNCKEYPTSIAQYTIACTDALIAELKKK